MAIKVGLIGCGNMGSLWDEGEKSLSPQTHARAFYENKEFELASVYDIDPSRSAAAAKKWETKAAESIEELLQEKPDVVSLCTPTSTRYEVIAQIVEAKIPLLFCEKPLAANLKEGLKIKSLLEKSSTEFVINYSRRWAPFFHKLKQDIQLGNWGKFKGGSGRYGKGLYNNGSHMINLFEFLTGPFQFAEGISVVNDDRINSQDPTLSVKLDNVVIEAVDHRNYPIFDMILNFERGQLKILDRGFAFQFDGDTLQKTGFADFMTFAVQNIKEKKYQYQNLESALTTLRSTEACYQSWIQKKKIKIGDLV